MTRDEHTTNRPAPGGSAFQETGTDDYLTRVAEEVRDATLNKAWQIGNNGPLRSAVDLQAVIASVPRPEPVAWIIDWPDEPELGHYLAERPSRAGRSRQLYAEPVAAQGAVPLGTPQNPICIDSEEMARLAEFAGISVDNREDAAGILLWVGEHRDDDGAVGYGLCASLEDYPEEGCYPLVELPRQQPADGAATLRSAIRAMAAMLQAREWGEHVSTDPDVTDLEVQITELVSMATALREQNATLVAALTPFALICKEGVVTKTEGHVAVTTCAEYFNRAEKVLAALASAKGGAA